ncbi:MULTISPECIES: restriction endonuclease subunit S [Enterobacteriaceae]|uniref:Restriction endonuclease subunit S n=1 Tax=Scandinavium lactucae TaxID=3095028 RepID=A0AAJ2VUC4_9ENTR|nr:MULTISPECIES: restriction endonuclease subunit S [Enterobacteriaceae]MBJ8367972.1 restriction endonuclease subunit S [Citrobacter cronae]MBJ8396370.1 restriction endonuclease subunit S [Citrobacter cronae]MBJ8409876.1 restriction endonuclease subunit S [Citrobacter cronae]MDX6021648.1 restriction endonuclease subunit S [Scandinavium sp. V105_16]MDX6031813.1 restriction endonuclease subunit S [Scandinavium sp. V105_12]
MSWPMISLGELVDIKGGGTPDKNNSEYWNGDIPWASVKDFKKNILDSTLDSITLLGVRNSATSVIPAGNIIVPTRMALGKVAINTIDLAINQDLKALFIKDNDIVDRDYLFRWLESQSSLIESEGKGATVKGITLPFLKGLNVPIPPINEQKRIAAILDKAEGIRQKREQAMKLANDFLRTTFLNMFGDPVENPKNLKKAPITELAEVITGFAFKSNEYISDAPESVRLCRGANTLTGYLDWADTKFWPKNKLEKLDNYLIKAGDIILAMDRPWISSGLKVCIFPENQRETYLVQRVARLRPRCESYTNYIYSCIKSPAFEKHCCPTETTVPHISPVELKNFEVLIPPDELMVNFHSIVSIINNSLNKMASGDIDSDALFSKLSQQAFSGHLKR